MADRFDKAQNDQAYRDRAAFGGQQGYAQQAANNYTSLGQAAGQRAAYQNNWAQNDQSRAQQGNAMGLMQNAAYGGAPSQAQIMGRGMIDQSLQAQMAGAASARGGSLAQAAAMRQAAQGAAAQQQQGMGQLSALRAQEMAQARGDYYGAASGMRGMDMQQQGMNMQSELAQRQLNQQGQQFYDQMGWNTTRADQEGALARQQLDSAEYMKQKEINQHSQDRETNVISSIIGGAGSMGAGLLDAFSDVQAKTDVRPMSAADADYVGREQARLDSLNATEAAMAKQAHKPGIGAIIGQGFRSFGGQPQPLYPIQARAMGGPVTPGQPYLVGEKGPELVVPQQNGMVLPNGLTQRLGFAGGGMDPRSGAAPASFDKLGGGGMDVMGSLKAHSNAATKFQRDPTGGMAQHRMMLSDSRAKAAAWDEGHAAALRDVQKMGAGDAAREVQIQRAARDQAQKNGGRGRELAEEALRQKARRDQEYAAAARAEEAAGVRPRETHEAPGEKPRELVGIEPKERQPTSFVRDQPQDAGFAVPDVRAMVSDERMKVIDLDRPEPGSDASRMRDGASDPRTHSFDASFHRDTPAEQRAVKRGVEDRAGRDADAIMAGYGAALAKGPATEEAMARANRAQEASSYAYKPEFTPPEQAPGEKNVGPMAQNLAADPVASTAVKRDPETGMLVLDGAKLSKLHSAGIASLQKQVDGLAALVAKKGRRS